MHQSRAHLVRAFPERHLLHPLADHVVADVCERSLVVEAGWQLGVIVECQVHSEANGPDG